MSDDNNRVSSFVTLYGLDEQGVYPIDMDDEKELLKGSGQIGTPIASNTITVKVSTVFLGVNHGPDKEGRPLLFETATRAIPDGSWEVVARHATKDQALAAHQEILKCLQFVVGEVDGAD